MTMTTRATAAIWLTMLGTLACARRSEAPKADAATLNVTDWTAKTAALTTQSAAGTHRCSGRVCSRCSEIVGRLKNDGGEVECEGRRPVS